MEYVENKGDPLIQVVRTHQHHTNSTLLQTVDSCEKCFQSEAKQIKHNSSELKREIVRNNDVWTIPA